jgi:5'-nucleotidase / UDP-sugar diphosphatase
MHHATSAGQHEGRIGSRRAALVLLLVGALLAALLPVSNPQAAFADAHDFSDISEANFHYDNIVAMAEAGIILGFPDGTFRPGLSITRGQMASLLARAEGLEPAEPPYDFTDIEGTTHAGNIQALADIGVIEGRPDGTFGPGLAIRRDQMASLVGRWLGVEQVEDGPFTDVPAANVHRRNINALAELGVMVGVTTTTFQPAANLRRDQTASVVARALDAIAADVDFLLTVLHVNDGESALLRDESATPPRPGAGHFVAQLQDLQAAATTPPFEAFYPDLGQVTVSSGDNFLAGPQLNASLEDEDVFYDALVYIASDFDAMTIGNHEFDFGPDLLAEFVEATTDIPFLSANLDFSGEPALQALVDAGRIAGSTIVEVSGRDVGIVGATYEQLATISSPRNVVAGPVLEAVQAEVDDLQAAGVEIIILSSHLQNLDEELELITQLSGVDAVVGGGGGEALGDDYPLIAQDADGRDVPVVTTPGLYRDIGQLQLGFSEDGDLLAIFAGSALLPVDLDGARDQAVVDAIEVPVQASIADLAANVLGTTAVPLDARRQGPGVRDRETNAGNLLADALLEAARARAGAFGVDEADLALQNGGGMRIEAIIPAGELTELTTFQIAAFANFVSVIEVDAETLRAALERSVEVIPGGQFGQWAGIEFTYDLDQPAGSRIVDATVTLADSTAVDVVVGGVTQDVGATTFTLATNDFTARGGDAYPFAGIPLTSLGVTYQQALAERISALGTITADDYPDLSIEFDRYRRFGPVGGTFIP